MARYSGERVWRRTRRLVSFASPAAGTELSITVPAGVLWEPVGLVATLVASAAVATRQPRLLVGDGSVTGVRVSAPLTATAGQTVRYAWLQDVVSVSVGTDASTAIPHLVLEPGWVVSSSTLALDVADQWSAIAALLYETTYLGGPIDLTEGAELLVEVVGGTTS